MTPPVQTAIVQTSDKVPKDSLPLTVSTTTSIPALPSDYHVLVRVLAVALNPTDHKMVQHFPRPGRTIGCDFCGIVEAVSDSTLARYAQGTRVCGAVFPYSIDPKDPSNGAFAQWVAADSRSLLRIPDNWSPAQGAALGGIGWGTVGLAIYAPAALALEGRPSKPAIQNVPVLVYGAGTATGTMAIQMLRAAGYAPLAVASPASASLALAYGATGTAAYTSATCIDDIRQLASGTAIRHCIDCITDRESSQICFGAMARTGGRYACLEALPEALRTRKAIQVSEVMAYEALGVRVSLGATAYTREANEDMRKLCECWAGEVQGMLNTRQLKTHPVREVPGGWQGVIRGLAMLQSGDVRGEKLVVVVAESASK